MKKRVTLIIIIAACIFTSCNSSDVEEIQQKETTSQLSQSNERISHPNPTLSKNMAKTRELPNSLQEDNNVAMTDYGYTQISLAGKAARILYKHMDPIVLGAGLPGGIYFVEIQCVTKELSSYRAGDIIIPTTSNKENKDMGLIRAGYFYTTLGWSPNEIIESGDKKFIGTTYLIHFVRTTGGAQLDHYYPCRPEKIVWRYTSKKINP